MNSRYEWKRGRTSAHRFWNADEIKNLDYVREPFNDPAQVIAWVDRGHQPRGGLLYDMRFVHQPATTDRLIGTWEEWYDYIGISYYRMQPGDNLPYHGDTYKKYIQKFNIGDGRQFDIWRYIFFVEDWKPGHILEIDGNAINDWRAGDWVAWKYDTPHMAANLGSEDRYTIQLTGLRRQIKRIIDWTAE